MTITSHHCLTLLISRTRGLRERNTALILWMWIELRLSCRICCSCGYFNVTLDNLGTPREMKRAVRLLSREPTRPPPPRVLHLGVSTAVTTPAWRPGACQTHAHATSMIKASQGPIKDGSDASTDEELYAWTMRREAVASCLIEDIFHLRPHPTKSESPRLALAIFCDTSFVDYDFGWLGRVPCRSVKIAGMVIGIKDYESKRIYTSTAPLPSSLSILIYTRNASQLMTTPESLNATIRISLHPSVPRNERIEHSEGSIIHLSLHQ